MQDFAFNVNEVTGALASEDAVNPTPIPSLQPCCSTRSMPHQPLIQRGACQRLLARGPLCARTAGLARLEVNDGLSLNSDLMLDEFLSGDVSLPGSNRPHYPLMILDKLRRHGVRAQDGETRPTQMSYQEQMQIGESLATCRSNHLAMKFLVQLEIELVIALLVGR